MESDFPATYGHLQELLGRLATSLPEPMEEHETMAGFSANDAAGILGWPVSRIYSFAKSEVVGEPGQGSCEKIPE